MSKYFVRVYARKSFPDESQLSSSESSSESLHTGEIVSYCSICERYFRTRKEKTKHLNSVKHLTQFVSKPIMLEKAKVLDKLRRGVIPPTPTVPKTDSWKSATRRYPSQEAIPSISHWIGNLRANTQKPWADVKRKKLAKLEDNSWTGYSQRTLRNHSMFRQSIWLYRSNWVIIRVWILVGRISSQQYNVSVD